MSFPMAGGSGAECGPVNPMAGLMKQFQQDRSLQQERFVGDQRGESSKAGFRSGQRSYEQPMADRQFADEFMNDTIAHEHPVGAFELNGLGRELEAIQHGPPIQQQYQNQQQQQQQPIQGGGEWTGDFMKQQMNHGASSESQFEAFDQIYQQTHRMAGPSPQHQELRQPLPHQHYLPHQRYIPQQHFQFHGGHHASQLLPSSVTSANTSLENELFERAFDAANQKSQVETATKDDWASEFAEKEGITEDGTNNDALARTAAMLLDSVDVNDNPKFKNSQFMNLMTKLRDGSVHVEGDKMVESSGKESEWSSEFNNGQAHQRQQQNQAEGSTRDWVDDFIPKAGDAQSGNMWAPEFASRLERGWAESSSSATQQQQNWSDQFQNQQGPDMSQEEMQRVFGRGTEMDDWVQQYQRNIAHLKDAKDSEWEGMQKDWDRFKDEQGMGYRAVNPDYDTYSFSTNNPYLMDHAAIDGTQHNSLGDSILALEAKAQLETNNAEAWQTLGLRQQENERDGAAIAAFRKAVAINPGLSEGWLALAVSYTNENCRADAYDSLEQWIVNNPTYKHLATQQNTAISDQDRHDYITNLFLEAARSLPGAEMDANVQVGLGVLFNVSEEYEKAIDCFRAAVASRPQDYLLWNKLGATLANSKDTAGAIDAYFNALEINPSYVRARYNLAISCVNLNQHKEAAEHLLTALALQQQDDMGQSAAINASTTMVDQTGQLSIPGGMSTNVWDSLRMVMFMMKREDLAVQCDRRNLDVFRSEFDF
ncbi:hypothetical protein BCR42DRAFT_12631 [Absidia repens]|uniref:Uncharacterized protein n=1 Tax=Absidia repens TaxID=90262 RepID=A0A1X2J1K1_9FUNG|nr:hypothetical protein BCR42DRAFT_12631 [Absidia repens]